MITCEPTVVPALGLGTKGYKTYHVSRLLSMEYVHLTPHVVTLISNPYHVFSFHVDRCRKSDFANSLISTPLTPEANGEVERVNMTTIKSLTIARMKNEN